MQLLDYSEAVESNIVKLETSGTVILPPNSEGSLENLSKFCVYINDSFVNFRVIT